MSQQIQRAQNSVRYKETTQNISYYIMKIVIVFFFAFMMVIA